MWAGVIGRTVFFLQQGDGDDQSVIKYSYLSEAPGLPREGGQTADVKEKEEILMDYFQLKKLSMKAMWDEWVNYKRLQWEAKQKEQADQRERAEEEEKGERGNEVEESEEEGEEENEEQMEDEGEPEAHRESRLLKHFKEVAPRFQGLRILRQDPVECLVRFFFFELLFLLDRIYHLITLFIFIDLFHMLSK